MSLHIIFYKDKDGNEPVKDFIIIQSYEARGEILHVFDLLYKFDLSLGNPYVEKVNGKIWALRIKHSSDYYRILYFRLFGSKFHFITCGEEKER